MDSVVSDFPGGLDFSGTDKNDYHAHAAATSQNADFILTQDRPSDFTSSPDNEVYEIITPDDFFTLVADSKRLIHRVSRLQHLRRSERLWRML